MNYDATLNRQLPSLPRAVVAYHVRPTRINRQPLDQAIAQADDQDAPLIIDWEADDAFDRLDPTNEQFDPKAIEDAHAMLDQCGDQVKVGFYGVLPPTPSHYNTIRIDDRYPEWRAAVGSLSHGSRSLVDRVDRLYPSLYLPATWRADWARFKPQAEIVAKRVAGVCRDWQKTAYPFIRPSGFDSPESWGEWAGIVNDEFGGYVIWEKEAMAAEWWGALQ